MKGEFSNMLEISKAVDNNDGVLSLYMYSLRDAAKKGRLGVHVLRGISENLSGLGLGHHPEELPNNQNEMVRLYRLGSPIAEVLEAALYPGEDEDEVLRERTTRMEVELLKQVRELVCE